MMFKLSNATRTAVSALALSFAAAAMPVVAQAQEAAAAPSEAKWFKTCAKQEESDVCVVQNQLVAANGQLITAVGLITVEGKVNRKLLQVTVPSARLIPPGVLMQIDGAKGTKLDYKPTMARDLELMKRGDPNSLGEVVPRGDAALLLDGTPPADDTPLGYLHRA